MLFEKIKEKTILTHQCIAGWRRLGRDGRGQEGGVEKMRSWKMRPNPVRDDRGLPRKPFPKPAKCCLSLSSGVSDASLQVYAGRRGKPSCGSLREEGGIGPKAGKGSQGPCYKADSPPHPLVSGLGLPFVHLKEVKEGKQE